jgi:hypothetical protein
LQVNPVTGYRRDVRRIVNPLGSNPGQAAVQWEWFDGSRWEAYPPEISVKVEAARAAGEGECDFTTMYGQDYRIEFGVDGWQVRLVRLSGGFQRSSHNCCLLLERTAGCCSDKPTRLRVNRLKKLLI